MSQIASVNALETSVPVNSYGKDAFAGFLVFLIALPLCLGISIASGCPPMAGVFTAIIGSILCAFVSNSELTIKGPAAGMIAIVLGTVTAFKEMGGDDKLAYQMMLAVGVAAGLIQIVFGLLKAGSLGEFFPTSAVHGLLAAIGVIIISKQIHVAMGVMGLKGEPFHLLAQVPHSLLHVNPKFAIIGGVSLVILFGKPLIKHPLIKMIPAQLIVIIVALIISSAMGMSKESDYIMWGGTHQQGPSFFVKVPLDMKSAITTPEFSALKHGVAWKWVLMFALIGTLESLLSAKAVDLIDPLKRKTDLNRDVLAVGIANTFAAAVGGLPMISEIVRSKANIDNGARTRVAGVVHGLCLLAFVALLPGLINQIPLAALAAMLVFTGFRLASPMEFVHIAHIGKEQLLVFVTTIVAVLMTDLLIGIAIGVIMEMIVHIYLARSISNLFLFSATCDIEHEPDEVSVIKVRNTAMFSNWISLRKRIVQLGYEMKHKVVVDLSQSKLVDHTVMSKLSALKTDFASEGLELEIRGLDSHEPISGHPLATRCLR